MYAELRGVKIHVWQREKLMKDECVEHYKKDGPVWKTNEELKCYTTPVKNVFVVQVVSLKFPFCVVDLDRKMTCILYKSEGMLKYSFLFTPLCTG